MSLLVTGGHGYVMSHLVRARLYLHADATVVGLIRNGVMGGYGQCLPVAIERYQVDRLTGDDVGVACALGSDAERVEAPRDLVPSFRRAIAATEEGRPALVECWTREERRMAGLS